MLAGDEDRVTSVDRGRRRLCGKGRSGAADKHGGKRIEEAVHAIPFDRMAGRLALMIVIRNSSDRRSDRAHSAASKVSAPPRSTDTSRLTPFSIMVTP